MRHASFVFFFFFNDTATTEIYTLSLHDALPIAAFPELNAWERAGADASSAGMVDAGFENQKELTKMKLYNQKESAEMQNETQKEISGIKSATSRQNTKDQVYAQKEMLAYQQKESTARVASIMENFFFNNPPPPAIFTLPILTPFQT